MENRKKGPKKGVVEKWSQRLKELGGQKPPKELMEILNKTEKPKKIAAPKDRDPELDL